MNDRLREVPNPTPIPERVLIPVMQEARLEDREGMIDLWARLLTGSVKGLAVDAFYIDLVRKLDSESASALARLARVSVQLLHQYKFKQAVEGESQLEALDRSAHNLKVHKALNQAIEETTEGATAEIARLRALGLVERRSGTGDASVPTLAGLQLLELLGFLTETTATTVAGEDQGEHDDE